MLNKLNSIDMKKLYALFMAIMVGIASGYADVTYTIKGYNGGTLNENYKFSSDEDTEQHAAILRVNAMKEGG